jgi:hypothetical protein
MQYHGGENNRNGGNGGEGVMASWQRKPASRQRHQ